MKLNHAQVMAHICQMTKQAGLGGALVGAGVGGVSLPLIDIIRGRKKRALKDGVVGALAGGAVGHGIEEFSNKGGPTEWANSLKEDNYNVKGLYLKPQENIKPGEKPRSNLQSLETGSRTPSEDLLQRYGDVTPTSGLGMLVGTAMARTWPGRIIGAIIGQGAGRSADMIAEKATGKDISTTIGDTYDSFKGP